MVETVSRYLVVARYKEDVSWIGNFAGWAPIIVQKETEDLRGDMPNAGREPSSFFFAIAKHFDSILPSDIWAFVQGNPFDHCMELARELKKPCSSFRWLGSPAKTTDGTGEPDHPNLPVAEKHREWLGREAPDFIDFAPGGQHMVSGDNILRYPKEFYVELMDDFTTAYNAWVAERLWAEIYKNTG